MKRPKELPPLWRRYHVRWQFLDRLFGNTPSDPEQILAMLDARKPATKPPDARPLADIQSEVVSRLIHEAEEEPQTKVQVLAFLTDNGHIAIRSDTIRAHLKDCARTISAQYLGRVEGEGAFSTRVIRGVYQDAEVPWTPVVRSDGSPISEPDGWQVRQVTTRNGSSFKKLPYILRPAIEFDLMVLGDSVGIEDLQTIMLYGGVHGYGGERSRDGGKYRLVSIEEK